MPRGQDGTPIGSDLGRLDAMGDDDIDYSDAPAPDLADWVRHAVWFRPMADRGC